MSNYHVEPVDRPQALVARGDQVAAPRTRSRASRGGSSCATRSAAAIAPVAARGDGRDDRLHLAEPVGRLRRQGQDRDARRRSSSRTRTCRSPTGSRPTSPRPGPTSSSSTPAASSSSPGEDTTRRRHGAQRPRPLPALPAPRLQAEPVPEELLVRVPLPRVALRPARDQGRRRPVRAGRRGAWTASRRPSTATAS